MKATVKKARGGDAMEPEDVIRELEYLKQDYAEHNNGAFPICLEKAQNYILLLLELEAGRMEFVRDGKE